MNVVVDNNVVISYLINPLGKPSIAFDIARQFSPAVSADLIS
jgi:predicted nucleic acid-binding protein